MTHRHSSPRQPWRCADDGQITGFVVVLVTGIIALSGLTLDGGLALAAKVRAIGQAEAAARAGAQAIDLAAYRNGTLRLIPTQAVADAQAFLATKGATGTATATNDIVTVTVTDTQPTQLLGLIGIESFSVHGQGSAWPQGESHSLALTTPAAAAHTTPPGSGVPSILPAIPGVPDVGKPGEEIGQQTESTIDPHGKPVWPSGNSRTPDNSTTDGSVVRSGWTYVVGVADGARIRTQPVTGPVVGLIPHGAYYWISCKVRGSDGYIWGYANHDRRYGWVRDDLWDVVYFTAPNAPAPRPIPWC